MALKRKKHNFIFLLILFIVPLLGCSQPVLVEYDQIVTGAQRINKYLPDLKGKNVALVANQSSMVNETHLVDTLLVHDVNIMKIFCPEHGFRGDADAGKTIDNSIDAITGISIVSLYGSHKKPTPEDMQDIDIVLFDLQDVGVRFYTYISTLTFVMEACAENSIPIIVLDRPNPNGFYIDGPVLEDEFKSFVGLHPVPIVYGMTIGEYAEMVNGEGWINNYNNLQLKVIELEGYNHNMIVKLKVKPSPNLPNWQSVYLYPSLCLFEGTIMSVGRGTDFPFQVYGHPKFMIGSFVFKPESKPGASNPKYKGMNCYGANLTGYAENYRRNDPGIDLLFLKGSYDIMKEYAEYFNGYFNKLAGNSNLKLQIKQGKSIKEIKNSWKSDIKQFMNIRSKYLIYD